MICLHCLKEFKGHNRAKYCCLECRILFNSEVKESGCREWKLNKINGYGRFFVKGKSPFVHRKLYELTYGELPSHIKVCHKCDNPACVNIDHLFAGTMSENMKDCMAKGRRHKTNGEQNGSAKLDWGKVYEIREKRKSGLLLRELAKDYGVDIMTIQCVVKHKTWVNA
jgi:hypothetical protein